MNRENVSGKMYPAPFMNARSLGLVCLLALGLNITSGSAAEVVLLSGFEDGELHVYTIDFCRLQFPTTINEPAGNQVNVYGRLYVAGLTDLSGVNNPAPGVIAYVGYGPDGSDPASGWTWSTGIANASYDNGSPSYESNNDEYLAVVSVPSPGTYDFAFRFSGDGGQTFTYCDSQLEGSSNGYNPALAGQMTSQSAGP